MVDIAKVATNLECREHGIWFSKNRSHVSYPGDGNFKCLSVEENSFWFKHRNRCLVQAIQLFPPNGTIFDVGGGNGYVSLAIKNSGMDSILVEPGYEGVINAYNRGLSNIICSTLNLAGFKPNSIPAIGIFDVLEHIEDDYGFLKTIKTLLVSNGKLYITVPAFSILWSIEDEYAGHFRRYTLKILANKLKSTGFEIEFKTYIFGLLPFPIFFFRAIPSQLGFRKISKFKHNWKEHVQPDSWFGRLINLILYMELKILKSNRTIPFGGSCLIIAKSARSSKIKV